MISLRIALVFAFTLLSGLTAQAENLCGLSFDDWCSSAGDSACGRHMNENDCRADDKCVAIRYGGESMVACNWNERGFADNCPAVGCQNR